MHTILGHPSTEQQETPEANLFKKVDCLIKLVNSMHQLLKSVIPGTGEWVTGGGNAGPDGFVPAVPAVTPMKYWHTLASQLTQLRVSYLLIKYSVFVFNILMV